MATKQTAAARKRQPAETTPKTGSGITIPDYDTDDDTQDLLPGVYYEDEKIPDDRVKLFHLEGKVYTAPKHLPPNLTFKFLREMRDGMESATLWLMEQVITPEVVDVLADHDDLTDEELEQIMKVIRKHTMSALDKTSGKSSNGRRK